MGFLDNGLSFVVVVFDHMLLTYYCAKCLARLTITSTYSPGTLSTS